MTRTSNIVGLAGAVPIELTSGLEVTPGLGGLLSGVQGADSHGALVHRGSGIATPPITGEQAAKKKPAKISEIDAYSRFLFPACFLLFNCFYWLYYLILFKK
ncbi:unnamed protein product [Protopolystoma xenopodis]|uniref:Neurotransmitter-gated ion-channel transmembrane domain-containing protein n=1 Tax=Protopolystoma xenopodis TaxID=117903 RepID=A0A3S5CIC1_9PLAT|nr:unnamed protein product [Protopolystoma xenopodis]